MVAVVLGGGWLALSGAACKDHVENQATDNAYLRLPGETPAPLDISKGPLFPVAPGYKWTLAVKSDAQTGEEETAVGGERNVGGVRGTIFEMRQGGKTYRQEVYHADTKGVTLLQAGTDDMMTMSPPIPLLQLPVKEGEVLPWNGVLHFQKSSAPGTALSRVSGQETVKTPAGTFHTYRLDTVIITTVGGQQVSFPATRWLAPGVGIVKQRLLAGRTLVVKELTAYKNGRKIKKHRWQPSQTRNIGYNGIR